MKIRKLQKYLSSKLARPPAKIWTLTKAIKMVSRWPSARLPSPPHSLPQNCNIWLVSTWRETLEWFPFRKSSFIKLLSFVSNRFRRELCEMLLCFHVLMTETMSSNFLFYEKIRHQISLHMPRPPTQRSLMLLEIVIGSEWMLWVPSCVRFSLKSRASSKKVLEYEKINLLINIRIYFMFFSPHFLPPTPPLPVSLKVFLCRVRALYDGHVGDERKAAAATSEFENG